MEKFIIKRKVVVEEEVSFNKYIALKVQEYRKIKGFTQEDFGNKIGLTRASIVNIEKGRQQVSMKNLYSICKFLEIKSNQLLPFWMLSILKTKHDAPKAYQDKLQKFKVKHYEN